MIDEGTLAGLLSAHAERIPVPDSAIDALLAVSPSGGRVAPTGRFARPSPRALAAVATVVVTVGAVWAIAGHSTGRTSELSTAAKSKSVVPTTAVAAPPTTGAGTRALTPQGGFTNRSLDQYAQSGAPPASTTGSTNSSLSAAKPAAGTPSRVVRTGTLDLRIARHSFGESIGRITTVAAAAGGFIADARTFESAAIPSGTVTIRIPSAQFNATVERLRKLGKVVGASTRGEDVSGQYTDLQARLRAATATRNQFLTVLARASNIGDILAVQDRIQAVQTQIEQFQGQLSQLNDQTTLATLTITVNEPAPKPKAAIAPPHHAGLSIAWDNARNGFARRVEGLISHSGSALVVLVGLLLLAGGLRLLVPRVRRLLV